MDAAATQLLRALRGNRSQIQLSRRLGYRSNVAADWEGGHRFPTGAETLRACGALGVDVPAALARFHAPAAAAWSAGDEGLAAWLRALLGAGTQLDLAARAARSRYQVHRWLGGAARPRLPDLLQLVDALTGRAPAFVAELVPIEQVPALLPRWEAAERARDLGWQRPWSAAVLALLEAAIPVRGAAGIVAARLGIPEDEAAACIRALQDGGLVRPVEDRWVLADSPSLQVSDPQERLRLRAFWAEVARARLGRPGDVFSFNVFGVSHADLERIRQVQREAWRAIRAIAAGSAPVETVGLLVMSLGDLADGPVPPPPITPVGP